MSVHEFRQLSEAELKEVFSLFDQDGAGAISREELVSVMEKLGQTVMPGEVDQMLNEVDSDKNGTIELDEFVGFIKAEGSEDVLRTSFDVFSRGTGSINLEEFARVITSMGEPFTQEEVSVMISDAGLELGHSIGFDDFRRLVSPF